MPLPPPAQARWRLELEVTIFTCRDNATLPYPECETQILAALLESVIQSPSVQQQWREAGGALRHGM